LRIRPFLATVEAVWLRHPDMRFGQLLMNVARNEDGTFPDTWNWENSEWIARLNAFAASPETDEA
jgi:hypothetical protein